MENVYVFFGEEELLKEKALKELKASVLKADTVNLDTFYGQNAQGRDIISCARTLPYFSEKRLVVLRDPQDLTDDDNLLVLNYIKNPTKTTVLAICFDDESYFKKYIKPLGVLVSVKNFKAPDAGELDDWTKKEFARSGKTIKPDAALLLKENIGNDLSILASEIEKLIVYTGKRQAIEKKDVEELVGKSHIQTGFELTDAISKKNSAKALEILHGLFKSDKKAPEIIGILGWYLRRLQKAKELLKQNAPSVVISERLRMPQWLMNDFIRQVNAMPERTIEKSLSLLLDCDIDIKTSKAKEEQAVEILVCGLLSSR